TLAGSATASSRSLAILTCTQRGTAPLDDPLDDTVAPRAVEREGTVQVSLNLAHQPLSQELAGTEGAGPHGTWGYGERLGDVCDAEPLDGAKYEHGAEPVGQQVDLILDEAA